MIYHCAHFTSPSFTTPDSTHIRVETLYDGSGCEMMDELRFPEVIDHHLEALSNANTGTESRAVRLQIKMHHVYNTDVILYNDPSHSIIRSTVFYYTKEGYEDCGSFLKGHILISIACKVNKTGPLSRSY